MKRRFIFETQPTSNPEKVVDFARLLYNNSNHQAIIHNRFRHLIQKLNSNNQDAASGKDRPVSGNLSNDGDDSKRDTKRKSYLMPNDLQDDLVECKCDSYMQVKSGYAEVIPNRFIIDTRMPFCALPKNIVGIIARRRVVLNEQSVGEFAEASPDLADSYKRGGTLSSSASFSKPSGGKRIAKLLAGTSPRNNSKSSNIVTGSQISLFNQQPLLANNSSTNPFHDHRFPVSFINNIH